MEARVASSTILNVTSLVINFYFQIISKIYLTSSSKTKFGGLGKGYVGTEPDMTI